MTFALFLTTPTVDCENHVRAWNSMASVPAKHVTFRPDKIRNDLFLVDTARALQPDVIFYIGTCRSLGTPVPGTFRMLRDIAPAINLVSDAADAPWHPVLARYRDKEAFDLQVAIDGARGDIAVDHTTLTPVDAGAFHVEGKGIRCGFAGSFGTKDRRGKLIGPLVESGDITRGPKGAYEDHARFLGRCAMTINTPFTGSGKGMHVKGRVLEAGWAKCALLEMKGSPARDWFPKAALIEYEDETDARELIRGLSDERIAEAAEVLSECVRQRYTAAHIYGEILDLVDRPVPRAAA